MMFWATLAAYELVWAAAVLGAGHALAWPGMAAAALFALWRLAVSRSRRIDLRLAAVAVLFGLALEGTWVMAGLIVYSAPWPFANAPGWLIGLWVAFAFTVVPLLGYLHGRPALAAFLGALGGPLAYYGAAREHALRLPAPLWRDLLALSLGWAIAMPTLTSLAGRWLRERAAGEPR